MLWTPILAGAGLRLVMLPGLESRLMIGWLAAVKRLEGDTPRDSAQRPV